MGKYYENGELILTGIDEELEQKRIDDRDRLEDLEKTISSIQDIVKNSKDLTKEELENLVGEIQWMIEDL